METNNVNAEGEHPAAPSCAPSTTPSAAGATAVASAAEPAAETAAEQARPITSFLQREEGSTRTRVAAAASTTVAGGITAGPKVEGTALPQQPIAEALTVARTSAPEGSRRSFNQEQVDAAGTRPSNPVDGCERLTR